MSATPLDKVRRQFAELKNERRTWETAWRDYKNYIVPHRGRFLTSEDASEVNRGDFRSSDKRVNSVASRSLSILASGIMACRFDPEARAFF